jgi:hypothetical protein
MRFASRLRLHVRRLVVPLGEDANVTMARLEAARGELDAGRLRLEDLGEELGGRIEDLGWNDLVGLGRMAPKAIQHVAEVSVGQHTTPYRGAEGLEVVQVLGREEPVARPFSDVREEVRDDLLRTHGQALLEEVSEARLREARLDVRRERLRRLIESGFGALDNDDAVR